MWIALVSIVVIGLLVGGYFLMGQPTSNQGAAKKTSGKLQNQQDNEFIQRLDYLLKIVMGHSAKDRQDSSIREVVRIGQAINEEGGFRYMIKIHEAVTTMTSPKVGNKLKMLWKGIGDWRA